MTADPTTIEAIWRDHHDELLRSAMAVFDTLNGGEADAPGGDDGR